MEWALSALAPYESWLKPEQLSRSSHTVSREMNLVLKNKYLSVITVLIVILHGLHVNRGKLLSKSVYKNQLICMHVHENLSLKVNKQDNGTHSRSDQATLQEEKTNRMSSYRAPFQDGTNQHG